VNLNLYRLRRFSQVSLSRILSRNRNKRKKLTVKADQKHTPDALVCNDLKNNNLNQWKLKNHTFPYTNPKS
jgi:hypothetical protein